MPRHTITIHGELSKCVTGGKGKQQWEPLEQGQKRLLLPPLFREDLFILFFPRNISHSLNSPTSRCFPKELPSENTHNTKTRLNIIAIS